MPCDIKQVVSNREISQTYQRSNTKGPLMPHPIPDRPWAHLGADILAFAGKNFLVSIDCFSTWLELKLLSAKSSLLSDNVPFSSYKFKQFAECWNFKVQTTSSNFPQANGLAEKAVDIAKRMLHKEYSYCCILIGLSPPQMHLHYRLKSKIPTYSDHLKPHVEANVPTRLRASQHSQKCYYDRSAVALPELSPNQSVTVQQGNKWTPATIVNKFDAP
ncbi:hypothetical protein PR048_020064 [Dryococelus australis]|uniref:Integrase catalytic domain-containing protein n=1 Tax=Dryococelus australis TaxID=614101 RepID=A0ABQ9H5G5_9NEOP|nr:hypothetical protein PR048_020064 [Dryococelus australis]